MSVLITWEHVGIIEVTTGAILFLAKPTNVKIRFFLKGDFHCFKLIYIIKEWGVFFVPIFSDYVLQPTNLKTGNFYYSGKLYIFRYLLPYLNYAALQTHFFCLPMLISDKKLFDLYSLNLKPFRKILIFPIKVWCWKKLSKKPIFNKCSGSPKTEFQIFWRQTKVPLPFFSFASNPSPMADLTVSSFRFSPNFTTKPVQSQSVLVRLKLSFKDFGAKPNVTFLTSHVNFPEKPFPLPTEFENVPDSGSGFYILYVHNVCKM